MMQMMSTFTMALISIISALLSGMWVWADKWSDVRLSINDLYMAFLMTGWMFLIQGAITKYMKYIIIGAILVITSLFLIRFQILVSQEQYLVGMIPHHSMAIFLSKKQLEQSNNDTKILKGLPLTIIRSQEIEIELMKQMLMQR
jgi:hypothetical protein